MSLALAVTVLAAVKPALAELTVEDLRGNAVTAVGPYYQDVADAIGAFAEGDYSGAFSHLQSAKKSTPPLPPPEIMMARLYFDANLPNPGNTLLEQAIRRDPEDPEALVMLGERALLSGRLTEAGMLFEKAAPPVTAFRVNPNRRQDLEKRLYDAWSQVDERTGKLADAQKHLQALLKRDRSNAAAMQRLGGVLFRLDNGRAAENGRQAYGQFKAAAAADPKMPPAEIAMAGLFRDKSKREQWIKRALELSGDNVRTQLAVGNYRMRENRFDEAKKHADKALALDPDGLESNLLAGMVAREQTDYLAAEKYFGAAHLLAPANSAIIDRLALVLIELPDEAKRQRALAFAELNAARNPNVIEPMATLGWVYYRLDRRKAAHRALSAALRASAAQLDNNMSADMGYYLAVLAADRKKYPTAIKLLKKSLDLNQPFPYRKSAQKLLAQVEQLDAGQDKNAKATDGQSGTRTGGSSARSR